MKKLFTLVAMVSIAFSLSAQEVGNGFVFTTDAGQTITFEITSVSPNEVELDPCAFYQPQGDLVVPEYVTDSNGISYHVTGVSYIALEGCTGITSVTLPSSVKYIGTHAFHNCYNMVNVDMGNGVEEIGYAAFLNCKSLTKVVIPDPVVNLPMSAFGNCSALDTLIFGQHLNDINNFAFEGDTSLRYIQLNEDLQWIRDGIFYGCHNLQSIDFSQAPHIGLVGDSAFAYCSSLSGELVFGNQFIEVGSGAFFNCNSITSIDLGNSVNLIGSGAFDGCNGITTFIVGNPEPPQAESDSFLGIDNNECTLYVPCGSKTNYENATGWSHFTNIEENCSSIEECTAEEVSVNLNKGVLNVKTPKTMNVVVTDALGRVIAQGTSNSEIKLTESGVVIVRCGNFSQKLINM